MPLNCQPGVYFLLTECRKAYTGETKKQVPNKERRTREGHVPEWQRSHSGRVKTIAVEPQRYRRKVREALEIRRLRTGPNEPTGINRDYGDYITTDTWKSLFTKINQNKHILTFDNMTHIADISFMCYLTSHCCFVFDLTSYIECKDVLVLVDFSE